MTEYYRGYVSGINRCRKPALMLIDAAEKQIKEMEARLAKAVEAIEELEDVLRQVDAWSDSWGTDPEAHLEPVFIRVKEVLTKGPPQNPTSSK